MSTPLSTERLNLREVRESDALSMFHLIHHNPNVLKTFLARYMEHESEANVDNLLLYQESGKLIYMIELKETQEVIGLLLEQEQTVESIELGYAIGEPYWNLGYMTEALKAVIDHLFHLEYQRITAQCFIENKASARVMEKCGMTITETQYLLPYLGEDHTVIEYEINK